MKNTVILLSILLSAGLTTSALAVGPRGGAGPGRAPAPAPRGNPANPDCTPQRDGTGGRQGNPNRAPNPSCEPKRDGTGGPNKPANPDCPQDGSGRPRG